MQFENDVLGHLTGTSFSNGLVLKICRDVDPIIDRLSIIENICRGRKIVHLGCVDHLPLIENKIRNNTWLHSRLCASATRCFGIDISGEGIEYMKDILGYDDTISADITIENINELLQNQWDYMVMGEILEHVDNPCDFLKTIEERYSKNIDRLIITVPNAFSWQNIAHTFHHEEFINTDHRYWFTPYTLGKVITQAGMKVDQFFFCEQFPSDIRKFPRISHPKDMLRRRILKRYPATRTTLVMVVVL